MPAPAPNLGGPEDYAALARSCMERGYNAFKIHANIFWNPHTRKAAPQLPGFPKEDVEICRAVREAVGDDITHTLMLDPFGVYTLEESLWVARELEDLDFYWLEHPMVETRVEAYRKLTEQTEIAICSPEHVGGGPFARAEWLLQRACDMVRIDVNLRRHHRVLEADQPLPALRRPVRAAPTSAPRTCTWPRRRPRRPAATTSAACCAPSSTTRSCPPT